MKKTFCTVILLLSMFVGYSQTGYSDFRDRFYIGIMSSVDFITSPLQILDVSTNIAHPDSTPFFTADTAVPFQTQYTSFFSLGLEPRYNVYEVSEDLAFAVSIPFTIGFGQAFPYTQEVDGAYGFANIQVPFMAKMYLGSTATYKSTENIGVSLGAGMEFNKVGLFPSGRLSENQSANKPWFQPVFSGSFHFWRGSSPVEVNIKYGFGQKQEYYRNKDGGILSGGSRVTKSSSFKLAILYLIDL